MNPPRFALCLALLLLLASRPALAADEGSAEALVWTMSSSVLEAVKADRSMQAGNLARVNELVDGTVMPHVDMARLTAIAMGPHWRRASPEQQQRLQAEFKLLLVRSYAGALSQVTRQQTVEMRPVRSAAGDVDIVVPTRLRGSGEPVPIDFRLYRSSAGWRIYDVSFLGVWMAENYRNTFAAAIASSGIDGLIETLASRNRAAGLSQEK